jgi:hypothetical protein
MDMMICREIRNNISPAPGYCNYHLSLNTFSPTSWNLVLDHHSSEVEVHSAGIAYILGLVEHMVTGDSCDGSMSVN